MKSVKTDLKSEQARHDKAKRELGNKQHEIDDLKRVSKQRCDDLKRSEGCREKLVREEVAVQLAIKVEEIKQLKQRVSDIEKAHKETLADKDTIIKTLSKWSEQFDKIALHAAKQESQLDTSRKKKEGR